MSSKPKTMKIDDVEYIRKDSVDNYKKADSRDDMPFQMVRTYSAGVFFGYVESRDGQEVVLRDATRVWSWSGAASLSQLSMEGTTSPNNCKFAMPVDKVELLQAIEILDISEKASKNLLSVKTWKL